MKDNLDIVLVTSGFSHIEKLNVRLYKEIERKGYHNLVTVIQGDIQQSLTIFKDTGNIEFKFLPVNWFYLPFLAF